MHLKPIYIYIYPFNESHKLFNSCHASWTEHIIIQISSNMVHFWHHGTFLSRDLPLNPSGSCIRFLFLLLMCFLKPKRRCCPAEKSVYKHIFIMNRNNKVSFSLCGHRSIISALSHPYMSPIWTASVIWLWWAHFNRQMRTLNRLKARRSSRQ